MTDIYDYRDDVDECTAETVGGYSEPSTCWGCAACAVAIDEARDDD